jgi:hypothetical protein
MNKFLPFSQILLLVLCSIVFLSENTLAQLTGVKTIPGSYTTMESAIADLNLQGVGTGGVTFNVAIGYTESVIAPLTITATGTSGNPIIFQKNGTGLNPKVTRTDAGTIATSVFGGLGDAIIQLDGTDYITFDGIDVAANDQGIEYGYYTNKPTGLNGCKFVTIKNSVITMTKGSSAYVIGIYISNGPNATGNAAGVTVSAASGTNSNVIITGNTIQNVHSGIHQRGASGFSDTDIITGQSDAGNIIRNFGGGNASPAYGIFFMYAENTDANFNIIDNAGNGGTPHGAALYGIYWFSGVTGVINATNNIITMANNSASGTTQWIYSNNTVTSYNFSFNKFAAGVLSSTGAIYFIYASSATNDVTIHENATEGPIDKTGASGTLYGYYNIGAPTGGTETITDNNFGKITVTGSSAVYPVYSSTSINQDRIMSGNVINSINMGTSGSAYLLYALNGKNNTIFNNNVSSIQSGGTIYGLYFSGTTPTVYNNQIFDLKTSAGILYGMFNAGAGVTNCYGNQIYNLESNAASPSLYGMHVSAGTEQYIYNNYISDLRTPSGTNDNGVRGINLAGTTALSVRGLYYNTIYLDGALNSSSGIFHTYNAIASTLTLDMRNNIVVNVASGSGINAAFRRSAATDLNNYSEVSNNNLFYAGGTNPVYYDGVNSDLTLADFKSRVAPREAGSVTENVPFVNSTATPYDLHIRSDIATQVEGGAAPVTSPVVINSDFDGNTRNATSPDIGADEFNGIGIDITPPSIVYSPLSNTSVTTDRELTNVDINDPSGVNITPGLSPRIYFKRGTDANTFIDNTSLTNGWKYTEASPSGLLTFNFTINYSLLYDGTGAAPGSVIQYFVVAQDLAGPNVGIFAGSFASTPASVNLTAAAFPISGNINDYTIIPSLSGVVTVGISGRYPTLTGIGGLFEDINTKVVSGNVYAEIISDITETGIHAVNEWIEDGTGNYTLTIRPSAAVMRTISGNSTGGLIRFNGADRVIFDGRFGGSGKYLTIENTSTATNTAAIHLISLGGGAGSTNNIIRNCIIKAGDNSVASTYGIHIGGLTITTSGTGADNNNNVIRENTISRANYGIYARGLPSADGKISGLVIEGNIIGSDIASDYIRAYGTSLQAVDGALVSSNKVYNLIGDVSKYAVWFGTYITNARVTKNIIHGLDQLGTSTSYYSIGINFSSATGSSDNQIDNNMIYDLNQFGSTTNYYLLGIRIVGGSGYKIYNNSISISGTFPSTVSGVFSHCLFVSTASTDMDVRNNIFSNTRTGVNPKAYTMSTANGTTFIDLNHNNYHFTGSAIGLWNGTEVVTFNNWKTATGMDGNSFSVDPMFTSTTDLHINAGVTPMVLESGGAFITGITTDIDGDVRPGPAGSVNGGATAPDLGADEFDGVPAVMMVYSSSTVIQPNTGFLVKNTVNNEIIGIIITTTGLANPIVVEGFNFTTTGTTSLTDITNAKVFYTGTSPVFAAGSQFGTTLDIPTAGFSVAGSQALAEGTNYFWLTFDIPGDAVTGNIVDAQCNQITINEVTRIPSVTNPAGNRSILGSLSGTYNVGLSQQFSSLSSVATALNTVGVSGAVIFNLTDETYPSETFPIAFNQIDGASAINSILIKPAPGVNAIISGSATSIIRLNGTDHITLDGSNSGSSTRNLTIRNNSATSSTAAVYVSSLGDGAGAENVTIKNCIIYAGSPTTTVTFGIYAAGTAISSTGTGTGNNNLRILNNRVQRAYNGIYVRGTTTGPLTDLTISGNVIGGYTAPDYVSFRGIDVQSASNPVISGNEIFNLKLSTSVHVAAIDLGTTVSDAVVEKNKIYGLAQSSGGAYGAYGINISSGTGSNNNAIRNNVIYDITTSHYSATSTSANAFGIRITGGTNHKVYFNSVHLYGQITGGTSAGMSAALMVTSATATGLDVRNNILSNATEFANAGSKSVAIWTLATVAFSNINYNDYYVSGPYGLLGYYGADKPTLQDWRASSGQDVNSVDLNPMFNADNNLVPQLISPVLAAGQTIAGITTDFLGITRNASNPSIGAFENGGDASGPNIDYVKLLNTSSTSNRTLSAVNITDGSGVNVSTFKPRIYYKKLNDNDVFGGNTSADNGWKWTETAQTVSPFSFLIDYSKLTGGSALITDTIQYFVAAQDLNSTPYVSANPSLGFNAVSVADIISAPLYPNSYKITQAALAGDYTIGLSVYNKAAGKDLKQETRKRKVLVEVPVEKEVINTASKPQTVSDSETGILVSGRDIAENSSEPVIHTVVKYETIEVEEEYTVLLENGQEYVWESYESRKDKGTDLAAYPNIAAAVADLNERGVSAPVRFMLVDANYSETYPIIFDKFAGSSAVNTVTIKPAAGVSPVISALPASPMFYFMGGSYIIFDGSNTIGGMTRDMTVSNSSSASNPIFRFEDGSSYNLIQSLNLNSQNTGASSATIYLAGSTSDRGNTNNSFINNIFTDRAGTRAYTHIYSLGTSTNPNDNTTISGNEFVNFSNYGIRTGAGSGSSWTINDNHFYNPMSATSTIYSIYLGAGILSKSNVVSGNYIGGSERYAGGDPMTTTSSVYGIYMTVDSTDASTVTRNVIRNISTNGTFRGVDLIGGTTNVTSNVIGDSLTAGSIVNTGTSTTTGIQISAKNWTNPSVISGNQIANLVASGTGTSVRVRGIWYNSTDYKVIMENNIIHHLSTQGAQVGIAGHNQVAVGISIWESSYWGVVPPVISGNTIFDISADNNSALATTACGIFGTNFSGAIIGNKIYNIKNASTLNSDIFPPIAAGIMFRYSGGSNTTVNNMVSLGADQPNGVSYIGVIGMIGESGNSIRLYNNTINISGVSASGPWNSYCFQRGYNDTMTVSTTVDLKNNIFNNQRTGGSGKHYAIHNKFSATGWGTNNSNYNVLNSSSPATVGYWLTSDRTFAEWKTASNCDGASYSAVTINYVNLSNGDLHLNMGLTATVLESRGTTISGLTFDFDGDVRPGPIGSVNGGATAPDLGADEFDGVPAEEVNTFPLSVSISNGWNMVSVPGMHPVNQNVLTWWSGKDPQASVFGYAAGYNPVDVLVPGQGYWLKNAGANIYNTGDEWPSGGINIVPNTPINGALNWNMIGGYHNIVSTSAITTNPPNAISAAIFGYANGYQQVTQLVPGYGYWLKLNQAAQILLPSGSTDVSKPAVKISEQWGRIVLTDNTGRRYTLYAADGETSLDNFELPPAPPTGMMDVRFESQRYAENLTEGFQTINFSGMEYPVTVRVENISIRLQDETGKSVNTILKPGEEISISGSEINKLMVSSDIIPDEYSLGQNYPNPFNPSTVIEFAIPEDASNVTLTIYDGLGQRVAELVNGNLQAGYYKYQWNAGKVASGIYIYQLRTEKFVSTKKMMLMK